MMNSRDRIRDAMDKIDDARFMLKGGDFMGKDYMNLRERLAAWNTETFRLLMRLEAHLENIQ